MADDFGGFVVTGMLAVALIGVTSLLMYEALRFAWRFMVRSRRRHGRILYALTAPFVPVGHMRMIAAAEALNGLLLIGWSVTFSFLAMEEFWDRPTRRGHSR